MLDIIRANIDRFKTLLETETDPIKRAMETRLLAEEEAKLRLTFLTRHSRLLPGWAPSRAPDPYSENI
jgi:hypothetical protein